MAVYTSNLELTGVCSNGVSGIMRLESEARKASLVEKHYVHGKWKIIKIYMRGELREIIVKRSE